MNQHFSALGGPNDLVDNPNKYLVKANVIQPIYPQQSGYIESMDSRMIGMGVVELGGGRRMATDTIDYSVGFSQFCHIGDQVEFDQPIAFIHSINQKQADEISQQISKYVQVSTEQKPSPKVIIERIKKKN